MCEKTVHESANYEIEPYFSKDVVIAMAKKVQQECLALPCCAVCEFDKAKAKKYTERITNGVYVVFESAEPTNPKAERRIVRIGTHNKDGRLIKRLQQHFRGKNHRESVFRQRLYEILKSEEEISNYMKKHLSFVVIPVKTEKKRLWLESKLIATLSWAAFWSKEFRPNENWIGKRSPKAEIQRYGLWLTKELLGEPLSDDDFADFKNYVENAKEIVV